MKLLTIKEAALLIDGLSVYRIRELCKNGELYYFKFGNKFVINSEDLLDYFASNKVQYKVEHAPDERSK